MKGRVPEPPDIDGSGLYVRLQAGTSRAASGTRIPPVHRFICRPPPSPGVPGMSIPSLPRPGSRSFLPERRKDPRRRLGLPSKVQVLGNPSSQGSSTNPVTAGRERALLQSPRLREEVPGVVPDQFFDVLLVGPSGA